MNALQQVMSTYCHIDSTDVIKNDYRHNLIETCEVRLLVSKGCFTAYMSGMTVMDEIFLAAIVC
jgi:hypothetical protein